MQLVWHARVLYSAAHFGRGRGRRDAHLLIDAIGHEVVLALGVEGLHGRNLPVSPPGKHPMRSRAVSAAAIGARHRHVVSGNMLGDN
eukprot:1089436-Pyramimonas_sp.AAC.2